MTPPNAFNSSNAEDEIRALVVAPVVEAVEDQLHDANEEFEIAPLEEGPINQDPYLPPAPTDSPPRFYWTWLRNIVNIWRREDNSRVPNVADSSTPALVSPIIGEAAHYTIPLLITRLFRHEVQIEELQNTHNASPSLAQTHQELQYLNNDHLNLRARHEHSEAVTIRELNHFSHRLDVYEEDFMNLRNMVEDIDHRVRSLETRRR